jgi:hypothetical protein
MIRRAKTGGPSHLHPRQFPVESLGSATTARPGPLRLLIRQDHSQSSSHGLIMIMCAVLMEPLVGVIISLVGCKKQKASLPSRTNRRIQSPNSLVGGIHESNHRSSSATKIIIMRQGCHHRCHAATRLVGGRGKEIRNKSSRSWPELAKPQERRIWSVPR